MQENTSKPSVGIDVGTSRVRVAVGQRNSEGNYSIVGVGESPISGMRKGSVVDLVEPARAIDSALAQAERMSGLEIDQANFSVNGATILSTNATGMVAIASGEVTEEDLNRLEDVARVGKVPANRTILSVVPHDYILDGQSDIKDPLGMTGSRLEIIASVVSVLSPQTQNLTKIAEMIQVTLSSMTPSVVAAAEAVLSEAEKENGVLVIDLGYGTTSMAIYEEGDLKFVAVLPVGANNLTNDLAIGLQTTPEVSELVKLNYADAAELDRDKQVSLKHNKKNYEFNLNIVDEVVNARLEEIFDSVISQLKKSGYLGKLPNGVVLVGGGANLKNIESFAKSKLSLAARVATPQGLKGVADKVEKPEYAAAVGLMMLNNLNSLGSASSAKVGGGLLSKIFGVFKSHH